METGIQEFQNQKKAQAIRWQGQQDYETLVESGVPAMEALKRTSPKLFFNDPRGMAGALEAIKNPTQATIETINGTQFIRQPTGHLIQVSRTGEGTENKSTSVSTKADGVTITERLTPTELAAREKEAEIAKNQATYDTATAAIKGNWLPRNWGQGANIAAANTASNALVRLGRDPMTKQPMQMAPPSPAAPPPAALQGAATGIVTVVRPDGKRGTIPAGQLDDALSQGYKLLK